ncbi:MAG: 6-phosphofructokinase [Candidatus Saganbacteria bacterium]|nr:6-phosphofructokinase [Candidatus Saganbacteria bacterium]
MDAIGVLTPGGDAPGMNTAIRAVVRTAIFHNLRVYGIHKGWHGLITGQINPMDIKSVGGIINRGGTILHTHRCPEFRDPKLRAVAYKNLDEYGIDGVVVIGGDGSLAAANIVAKETDFHMVHIPASIDNDISCTDYTIGFDTAVNTALDAVDKIRDTAASHERVFVIEVMGRKHGILALEVGLVCGAEEIIIPEAKFNINKIADKINEGRERGKTSFIIVVAEGAISGAEFGKKLQKKLKRIKVRVSVLGHIQRGGSPTAISRELACKMGAKAVESIIAHRGSVMMAARSEYICAVPFKEVLKKKKRADLDHLRLAEMLSI